MGTISTDTTYTFTVTGNRSLTAVFEKVIPTYTITATIDPPEAGAVTGAGQYQEGETVTLTAVVNDGYAFTGWQENGQTVSTSNPYTFIATGNKDFSAVFEKHISRLPEGYTEVEYIESSGAQMINTGVNPSNSLKTVVDIEPTNEAASSFQCFFGSVYRYTSSSYIKFTAYAANRLKSGIYVGIVSGQNNTPGGSKVTTEVDGRMIVTLDGLNGLASVNENSISISRPSLNSRNPYIYLFRMNLYNSASSSDASITNSYATAKLYSCSMELSGELVRDFVPCTDPTGAAGLYDLVEGKFYANAGTGAFTAGPAV